MSGVGSGRSIVPPATLGLMGGGQLGRMTALAARSAGFQVHALDPDPLCAIRPLADNFIAAEWADAGAATRLAHSSDVVTFEVEKISATALEAAAHVTPVRPGPEILHLVQNRLRQKSWLQHKGFPIGPFRPISNPEDLRDAARDFGRCFVKATEGGYDGRSQFCLDDIALADFAWNELGRRESIAEKAVDLEYEISVLIARRPNGETCVYPPALNHHEKQILAWSVIPAPISRKIMVHAQDIVQEMAAALALEGLLVVEMFVTRDGQLLVNELAPRPHNSYHASERACVTGQFEQLIRAVCNLPLGSAGVVRPTAIVNLLGDLWTEPAPPDFANALRVPETRLHLYGKSHVRPGRKMGHFSATGRNSQEALDRALQAKRMLVPEEVTEPMCSSTT